MIYTFSEYSLDQLSRCHNELKLLCTHVLDVHDFKVQEGHRDEAAQEKAFAEGRTKLHWPNGNHNAFPSMAVDLLPYLDGKFIGWENRRQWDYFGGMVLGVAATFHRLGEMTYPVRWGGDWSRDNDMADQTFNDLPHFELVTTKGERP